MIELRVICNYISASWKHKNEPRIKLPGTWDILTKYIKPTCYSHIHVLHFYQTYSGQPKKHPLTKQTCRMEFEQCQTLVAFKTLHFASLTKATNVTNFLIMLIKKDIKLIIFLFVIIYLIRCREYANTILILKLIYIHCRRYST